MKQAFGLWQSSVGKKVTMAVSGIMLLGFVVAHLLGNFKVFSGQAEYDAYAEFLREMGSPVFGHGELLWVMRLGLIAVVGVHILAAVQLTQMSRSARSASYQKPRDVSLSYASRTMRWGGVIVVAFVVYHLLHLTFGTVHSEFEAGAVFTVSPLIAPNGMWIVQPAGVSVTLHCADAARCGGRAPLPWPLE